MSAVMKDISCGGTALQCDQQVAPGTPVEVVLPSAGGLVAGRVARSDAGLAAIAFRQDEATFARVRRVLDGISAGATARAA